MRQQQSQLASSNLTQLSVRVISGLSTQIDPRGQIELEAQRDSVPT